MMPFDLSMTGVAVDMFVQIQFGVFRGSTVLSNVRRQIAAPVAVSSAARVFDAESVYRTVLTPCGVRTPCATSGAVSIELPDSISIDTSLSICVFHFRARRPTDCLVSAVSPRFQPLRSMSPPHVSHSRERPVCPWTAHDTPTEHKTSTRHVARMIFMPSSFTPSSEKEQNRRLEEEEEFPWKRILLFSYSPVWPQCERRG